ncbi:MAG: hypothetical protein A3K06_02635 [Candidatus Doudnabacteria bacterium RIFCSPHIGHO2_01_52_17]|uniref:DUF559 domain-containing protein n=1 Tax=Candidatus Doudnabacteria bacterium RIFCSPHIGHO2_01_52_17 TaxID=1817820 RepID=A0A1F5NFH7_9BACT|nr:MAG: hypothetical protein A3K06_02635 [Candidatus Doudnabacteria bacterium RIFCSPHIGHO2_01_52_17]
MQIHKKNLIPTTRRLRREQTPWENKVWYFLRGDKFLGLKFKRQVMLGEYIVDFCRNEKKLIIEIDGGQHSQTGHLDSERTDYFELYGYKVLRFWNSEVDGNLDGVLETIRRAVINENSTSPLSSPGLERR